jgi:hypothetical protein
VVGHGAGEPVLHVGATGMEAAVPSFGGRLDDTVAFEEEDQ